MSKIHVKLSSAIALAGGVVRSGTILEVDERLARELLHRGKATLATEADAPQAAKAEKDADNSGKEQANPAQPAAKPAAKNAQAAKAEK